MLYLSVSEVEVVLLYLNMILSIDLFFFSYARKNDGSLPLTV